MSAPTLLQAVSGLGGLTSLSRLLIVPGPGRSQVVATFAAWSSSGPVNGINGKPLQRGPVSLDDQEGLAALRPPVTLSATTRVPDIEVSIVSAGLPAQIAELNASRVLGTLNVERLGTRKIVISAHAGTQAERSMWLFGLLSREA